MKRTKIQKSIERKNKQKKQTKEKEKRSHNSEKAATDVTRTFHCSLCSDLHKNN